MIQTLRELQKIIDDIKNILDTFQHSETRRRELIGQIDGLEMAKIIIYRNNGR